MSTRFLARDIASRLHHRGAYISPECPDIGAYLAEIAATDLSGQCVAFDARKLDILSSYGFSDQQSQKPFAFANGMAIIPITGILVNRLSWGSSYATGYNFIRSQMNAALEDPEVEGIVFDVNSYGGTAAGCGELAQEIYDSRDVKPSLAVVDGSAYSAAYYLASAASEIAATPSSGIGSIGVVAMHVDYSEMLSEAGIKVTFIHAGAEKVDGNPYQKLSSRAKASMQKDVDYHYGLFTDAVARQRDMPSDDVRGTEAASFMAPEAMDRGLIDAIAIPADAIAAFRAHLDSSDSKKKSFSKPTFADIKDASVIDQTPKDDDAAGAVDMTEEIQAAVAAALKAERTRQAGIRTCDEAKGRETLADHLANNTEMSVEDAKSILAASAKAASPVVAATVKSGFAMAMERTANPNIAAEGGGEGSGGAEDDTPSARASRILSSYAGMSGRRVDPKSGMIIDAMPLIAGNA